MTTLTSQEKVKPFVTRRVKAVHSMDDSMDVA